MTMCDEMALDPVATLQDGTFISKRRSPVGAGHDNVRLDGSGSFDSVALRSG